MGVANDLLGNYQHIVKEMTLVPATGGVFEVEVDGDLIYSKKGNGRHALPGEVLELFTGHVGEDIPRYGT